MSFGVSIGDLIKVLEIANDLRGRFVEAPESFKAISQTTTALAAVLEELKSSYSKADLTSFQADRLANLIASSETDLEQLLRIVGKYHDLDASPSAKSSLRRSLRVTWKRVRFEPDEVQKLRARINDHLVALSGFCQALDRNTIVATNSGVIQLQKTQEHLWQQQDRNRILNWLSNEDFVHYHHSISQDCCPGTSQWLLKTQQFKDWYRDPGQLLLCHGNPGAGKTFTSATVIDHLQRQRTPSGTAAVSYLYCDYRRPKSSKDMASSIIRGLLCHKVAMPDSVVDCFARHEITLTPPDIEDLRHMMLAAVGAFDRAYLIIDALDEVEDNGQRIKLLSFISNIRRSTKLNVLITTRPIPDIVQRFAEEPSIELAASESDIASYIRSRMDELPRSIRTKSELEQKIIAEIQDAANGVFLLARLHFQSLHTCKSVTAVKELLEALPRGSNVYHETYDGIVGRLEDRQADWPLAQNVLGCIAMAHRSFTLDQLRIALALDLDRSTLTEDDLVDPEEILGVCGGLVELSFSHDAIYIQFVHFTVLEYFKQTWRKWFPDIQTNLALLCLNNLDWSVFRAHNSEESEESIYERLGNPRLAIIDATLKHTRADLPSVPAIEGLDSSEEENGIAACRDTRFFPEDGHQNAAFRDLGKKVNSSLDQSRSSHTAEPSMGDQGMDQPEVPKLSDRAEGRVYISHSQRRELSKRQPAMRRSVRGTHKTQWHLGEIKFSKRMASVVTPQARRDWRVYLHAALLIVVKNELGKRENATSLLDSSDRATMEGDFICAVGILFKNFMFLDRLFAGYESGSSYTTAPIMSIINDLVNDDLMMFDVRFDSHDKDPQRLADAALRDTESRADDRMMLRLARRVGCQDTVQSLLAEESRSISRQLDGFRHTVDNSIEFEYRILSMLDHNKFLLRTLAISLEETTNAMTQGSDTHATTLGASWKTTDFGFDIPAHLRPPIIYNRSHDRAAYFLHMFVDSGMQAFVDLLLSMGVSTEYKGSQGMTPLAVAASKGHNMVNKPKNRAIVEAIQTFTGRRLDKQAVEMLLRSQQQQTQHSVGVKLVRSLLDAGADLESVTDKGSTPLCLAVTRGNAEIATILLDRGANVNHLNDRRETPLVTATRAGRTDLVRELLGRGANLDIPSHEGQSPLCMAAASGKEALIKALLDGGADPNEMDRRGTTPLIVAVEKGFVGAVDLLLIKGDDPNLMDRKGVTPAAYASRRNGLTILKALVKSGAETKGIDIAKLSPLAQFSVRHILETAKPAVSE